MMKELKKHLEILSNMEDKLIEQLKNVPKDTILSGNPTDGGATIGDALLNVRDTKEHLKNAIRLLSESKGRERNSKVKAKEIQTEPEYLLYIPYSPVEPS